MQETKALAQARAEHHVKQYCALINALVKTNNVNTRFEILDTSDPIIKRLEITTLGGGNPIIAHGNADECIQDMWMLATEFYGMSIPEETE